MFNHKKPILSYFEKYLLECEYTKQLSPHTMSSYRDVMKNFLRLLPEIQKPEDLQPFVMHEFFKRLGERSKATHKQLKTSTIRTYYNKLLVFFRWLESNEYIPKHSLSKHIIKPPNPQYHDQKALAVEDIAKIINSIAFQQMDREKGLYRDLVILNLLRFTGIRKGELLGLRIQDVNFSNRTLFIRADTSKSKKSRHIPLHYELFSTLKTYLRIRQEAHSTCEALITSTKSDTPFTAHGLKHWVQKYNERSGVSFHLHQFRHTFACQLALKGTNMMSIRKILGHASTQMTEKYLRSIQTEDARCQIDAITY